jgi:hypothetical protein
MLADTGTWRRVLADTRIYSQIALHARCVPNAQSGLGGSRCWRRQGRRRILETKPDFLNDPKLFLFFEEGEGYVKALEKSTSPSPSMREVFELYAQDD